MKIFYSTRLFNGLQIGRFDPFCLESIRSDRATITISLQSKTAAQIVESLSRHYFRIVTDSRTEEQIPRHSIPPHRHCARFKLLRRPHHANETWCERTTV